MRLTHLKNRCGLSIIVAAVAACVLSGGVAAQGQGARQFPYDQELRFDADPLRGSKRVPGLQVTERGAAEIDLWCVSGKGQAVIVEDTITIVPLSLQDNQCPADRLEMDKALLEKLAAVTNWRWEGQTLVLVGPQMLRFRPASN